MKWTIEYVEEHNYVNVIGEGVFSIKEHPQMFEDIVSREYWQPGMALFFDNRNVDFGATDFSLMRQASQNYERFGYRIGNGKAAMLMKSVADFGRGRQFENLSDEKGPVDMRVFLDKEEAVKWLISES